MVYILTEITKQMMKNRREESQTFCEFDDLFQDPKKLTTLTGFVSKKFNIQDASTTRLMSSYFIFHGLNYLETSTRVLKEFVNPSKKIGKKKIKATQNTTLHQLVVSLSQELGMAEFEDLFPKHFYGILGGSAWYFKNNGFSFIDEHGNGVSFTQESFVDLIKEFDSNFVEIIDEWMRRNAKKKN
jgi:ribosomal protein S18